MNNYKYLNIKGTSLEESQLEKYLKQRAEEHVIKEKSESDTYPIQKLKENFENILKTYELLNEHLKLGIKIHSAGEWLLDNFYIIEETVKSIEKSLNKKEYIELPGIANGKYQGFSRIYVLASEIVAFGEENISESKIINAIQSYQTRKVLSMKEIWKIGEFMQIALIQEISEVCKKIYYSQIQKYKVENIYERLIELKSYKDRTFVKNMKNKVSNNDINQTFIEYMTYKLRRIGTKGAPYLEVLEKQVKKIGIDLDEIVKSEHLYVATLKIKMGSYITSIKKINRINLKEVFNQTNKVEELLNNDPSQVFRKQTEETKEMYRKEIQKISDKTKISEIYISEEIIKLASRYKDDKENKKSHVGYYLIDEGKYELKEQILEKKVNRINKKRISRLYLIQMFIIPLIIDFAITIKINVSEILKLILTIIMYVPIYEIWKSSLNNILRHIIKQSKIPKINYENGIDDQNKTMVVIPCILDNEAKVKEMFKKIEVYYLANEDKNIFFTLLGDCTTSEREVEKEDKKIIESGKEEAEKLNQKYNQNNKFNFLYRKRIWNPKETCYMGWERKRGLLIEFNRSILKQTKETFLVNTLENFNEKIKYVITLDSDTNLIIDSAQKMVGAMSHILNKPVIEDKVVKEGYGIMQPRIGISLEDSKKTIYTKIFSTTPGIDFYTNNISDIYQDCFKEGIYTGKGIYDLEVYQKIIEKRFPENRILSHDLIEGSYLRCGLLTDVVLLDTFPKRYLSSLEREHRWIRGDWQIATWSENKKINGINRFKIFDNLIRSTLVPLNLILLIISIFKFNIPIFIISMITIFIGSILEIINKVIFKKSMSEEKIYADKMFSKNFSGIPGNILRNSIELSLMPTNAYNNLSAIFKSLYRLKVKRKLLEWKTSESVDRSLENTLENHCKKMIPNIIVGIIMFGTLNPVGMVLGTLWILAPYIAWKISKEDKRKTLISGEERIYLENLALETWKYFDDTIIKENNYLVPDNFQLGRKEKFVNRTSSTNIGLEILSIISAYDMKFITLEESIDKIEKVLQTIEKLKKWNGHLYNWYNIKTLVPLKPEYVSTVDSGNFIGYMYVLKSFLEEKNAKKELKLLVDKIIKETDFSYLYSKKNRLFSIGFDITNNILNDSYYDFLASEARQSSLIAIAKKDVKYKHWINLSRTLTSINGYKGLISWSGTAFEYLMPNLIMDIPEGSLIDESCEFAKEIQKKYANRMQVPWGISESAYCLKDLQGNYQYKAFGIPGLGLKRGLEDELVVSPYSSILFLEYEPTEVINNLKQLEKYKMRWKYGFFDSLDFTKERILNKKEYEPVQTYMAHHQGLILNSINNVINKNKLKHRFLENPEIESVKILLDERMPETVVLSKETRNKVMKGKYTNIYEDKEIEYTKKEKIKRFNAISSENYTNITNAQGEGYSVYKDIQVNRYKFRNDINQGIGIYFKRKDNNKIWSSYLNEKTIFTQYKNEFMQQEEGIETTVTSFLSTDEPAEIKKIILSNKANKQCEIETYMYFEPILSRIQEDIAHPTYNNMFLEFEYLEKEKILICSRKNKGIYLGIKIVEEDNFEFEIEKEKFIGRNQNIPKGIEESKKLESKIKQTVEPIIALKINKTVKEESKEEINIIIQVSEEKEEIVNYLSNISKEKIENMLEVAKAKSEEEIKFLEVTSDTIENNQKLIGHLIQKDIPKQNTKSFYIEDIWKFGISGDHPIILLKIKRIEELYVLDELLETIEFFKVKNIKIDLIILNEEKISYETFIKDGINESIENHRIDYLRNNQIYLLNKSEITQEDIENIKAIADITIKANIGGIKENLEEIEKQIQRKSEKNEKYKTVKTEENIQKEETKYYNDYGGFTENEYIIDIDGRHVPPRAWSNIMANKEIGTVVTENSGGYTWYKNSRLRRITHWENDSYQDFSPEKVVIKDLDKKEYWYLGMATPLNKYQVKYGLGYSTFKQINNGLIQENKIFIPVEDAVKINSISLKNREKQSKRVKIQYILNMCLGENKTNTLGRIKATQKENTIYVENICKTNFEEIIEITSNEQIELLIDKEKNILEDNILIAEITTELKPFERKTINIILGKNVVKYAINEQVEEAFKEVEEYWNQKTSIIKVQTPSEKINLYMNKWLIYQTLTSRLRGKSGFYQSGGALGFRDQLQDALGMKWIDERILYKQILEAAKHQFIEGDVMHWWHNTNQTGIRTKISDDLLWLPYSVLEYIEFTEDISILDEQVEYVTGIDIQDEKEKYDKYRYTEEKDSIYNHCMKAIFRSLEFGKNGFPKIGTGDWNDGLNRIGQKGEGESVWLGFFLYDILNKWEKILELKNEKEIINKFKKIKDDLKEKLNTNGWDGRWYKRAITDDGQELGSSTSDECKIDSIAQSWSVISEAGEKEKQQEAMDSVIEHLVDKENKIIKLLTPAFTGKKYDPGYISHYPIGVRENGGQYTHSSIWTILALGKLNRIDEALEYLEMINPITHTESKEKSDKYKIEGYVIAGDVYSNPDMLGRGGWSWYTGSSSWYYKVCLEEIIGIKRKGDKLYLPNKIPRSWNEYKIQYRYKTNIYNITIKQNEGEKSIYLNGEKYDKKYVILKDENKIENVEIKM